MASPRDTAWLIEAMSRPATRSVDVVNAYYTLCIPFYREFLGAHWHTGFYAAQGPIGPADQLLMERHIAASAAIAPGSRVLDVGCGMGGPACHIARITGAEVHGLTPNAVQLQLARTLAREQGLSEQRVRFTQGDAAALPFEDASFDTVLFFESACHFPERARFFREARRVLKPGGRLAGEDWIAATGLSPAQWRRHLDPIHETWAIPRLDTLQGYAQAMAQAGLQVIEHVDLRDEMALARGFLVQADDRHEVEAEIATCPDPVRVLIMRSLLHLGEAMGADAFSVGRWLAVKPEAP